MANPLRGYVRQHGYVAILLMGFVVFHLLLLRLERPPPGSNPVNPL